MIPYLVLRNFMKNIHLLDFNSEKQMIVFCMTICSSMKKCHFPRFLNVLGWIKNSMFSYNLVEIHYLYLWFVRGTNTKLSRFGMLINLAPYIRNFSEQNPYSLIKEPENRKTINRKGTLLFLQR